MSRESPTLKIGAALLRFGHGADASWQARLGVLHKVAPTAAQAKRELSEDVAAVLGDPAQLLEVALEAAARNDVDVAAVAARRGFRLAPVQVSAGEVAEPVREVVVPGRRLVDVDGLEDGMLVACEWRGGRAYRTPELALVQTRTPAGEGQQPDLFVEFVSTAAPTPGASPFGRARVEDPASPEFRCPPYEWPSWFEPGDWGGQWRFHLKPGALGEIEVLASGLPRGVSGAEVRRLAELAGWPDRFLGPEAELRRLVRAVLGVALEGDAARRTALVAEAVGRLRAAESSRAALLRIVDQTAEEPASLSAIRRAVAEVEPDGMRREAAERALVALLGEGSP